MIVIDEALLAEFRYSGTCERCGRRLAPLSAHHALIKRGMGGGRRLDLKENVAGLCEIPCHNAAENSKEVEREVQEIVARREGTTVEALFEWLWAVLRAPKGGPIPRQPWVKVSA